MTFGMPTLLECETIEENLVLCRELGLDFIELNMNLPQYQTRALRDELDKYRRLTAETGVFFTLHLDENLNFVDFNPLVREAYDRTTAEAIHLAKSLQIPVINLHMPRGVYFTLPEKKVYLLESYASFFMEAVRDFRGLCEREIGDAGIQISIENTDGYRDFQKTAVETLLESPCFALTWDIGHSHAANDVDAPFLLRHKDRLAHFHLHDAIGKNNHLALGAGEIDLPARLQTAAAHNCRCVIETKTAEALEQSVKYLDSKKADFVDNIVRFGYNNSEK